MLVYRLASIPSQEICRRCYKQLCEIDYMESQAGILKIHLSSFSIWLFFYNTRILQCFQLKRAKSEIIYNFFEKLVSPVPLKESIDSRLAKIFNFLKLRVFWNLFKYGLRFVFIKSALFGWELFAILLATRGQRLPRRCLLGLKPQILRFPAW